MVPIEYNMSKVFGWTPDQIEKMSAHDFNLYAALMRAEKKAGKLASAQAKFYGK